MMEWRRLGNCHPQVYHDQFVAWQSPLVPIAQKLWEIAYPHTILCLAQLFHESAYATRGIAASKNWHNCLGQRPRPEDRNGPHDMGGFMSFPSWEECVRYWRRKITDSSYGYETTVTVEEFVHVYAPASDGNDEASYVKVIMDFAGRFADPAQEQEITTGRVPHPPYTKKIVPKPYDGAGYWRLSSRRQIVGVCSHRTLGLGGNDVNYQLFATGGERQYDALTDYCIDLDGNIWMFNEPEGTRSPWANGGSDGLEGDGPLFVRTFGVSAINDRLVSVEHVGMEDTPFVDKQFEASAHLLAYWHDRAGCHWDSFPLHQGYGVVTDLQHYEFALKDCPFRAFRKRTNDLQNRVRAIMKYYQERNTQRVKSVPPAKPVEPDHTRIPEGLTLPDVERFFGELTVYHSDGKKSKRGFNIKGAISNAWLSRGVKEGMLPAGKDWIILPDGREIITFENGWVLFRQTPASAWRWIV
ncbi:MAG: hypothetical protein C4321_01595 [Chloroflexota bacterium]